MSPTIVLRDGKPLLAVGSPGGSTIITTVLQILLDRLDLGLTLPAGDRRPAAEPAEHGDDAGGAGVPRDARGDRAAERAGTCSARLAEIGAATGIEFLGGGRLLAAAEPVRRGGGSAMVVSP